MDELALIFAVVFVAIGVQSATGFGFGLVAMSLLTPVFGAQTAAPMMALTALLGQLGLLWRFRKDVSLPAIWRLIVGSFAGIPFGVWGLRNINADIITRILGVVVVGYSLYALIVPTLPDLRHRGWEFFSGFLGGVLGGAYNTGGPPVVMYAHCKRWQPGEFKGNLQAFFNLTTLFALALHYASGNLTSQVWQGFLAATPALALGIVVGGWVGNQIKVERFQRLVLILLLAIGMRLIFF